MNNDAIIIIYIYREKKTNFKCKTYQLFFRAIAILFVILIGESPPHHVNSNGN